MTDLTFTALREANVARLPQFKNKHGELAHTRPDGSDWSPAQWLQALVGEIGEFAELRIGYEMGKISEDEYAANAAKELADIQTYLDILARRALDTTEPMCDPPTGKDLSDARRMMYIIFGLGTYADATKKRDRGDITEGQLCSKAEDILPLVSMMIDYIINEQHTPNEKVTTAHSTGIDLGVATAAKFNEVSKRVGSTVRIVNNEVTKNEG